MHGNEIFFDITIIFLIASVLGLIMNKLKQPSIVAYIATGLIVGPNALAILSNHQVVEELSEIGVVSLLFVLGLEFSLEKIKESRTQFIFTGILQIVTTIIIVTVLMPVFAFNIYQAVFIGCIIALSSTVVVIKSLADSAQMDSLHGRLALGILIMQDLSLIPIMIILPQLTHEGGVILLPLMIAIVKAGLFLVMAMFIGLKLMPGLMNLVTKRNKEFLIFTSISIALGTAIIATYFGISLELGAFIAGFAISGTVQSKQVIADIIPLRDVFSMVFFVSIGMLLDISYFIDNLFIISLIVFAIFALKSLIIFIVSYLMKYPGQTSLWAALSLFQIGEFSFIIAKLGYSQQIISEDLYQLFINSTLITLLITPFVVKTIPFIVSYLSERKTWNKYFKGPLEGDVDHCELVDHVIIAGFGPIGRAVAKILSLSDTKYVVVELNNKSIQELKKQNVQAIYGDATHEEILHHANIHNARVFVFTVPDYHGALMAINKAKSIKPDIFIIVRARFITQIEALYSAGANIVIYEEYETFLSMAMEILSKYEFTQYQITTLIRLIQENQYKMLQSVCREQDICKSTIMSIQENEVEFYNVPNSSQFSGKTLIESNIRYKTGLSVISIRKGDAFIVNPSPDTLIEPGDILALLGTREQVSLFKQIELN